jgi:hypothetical protein
VLLTPVDEDYVCPTEDVTLSKDFWIAAVNKPLTVKEFAEAMDVEVCEISRALVAQKLTKQMGYKELGHGLYIDSALCLKVTDHHVRLWDPRKEFSIKQTHREFLERPNPFFNMPHAPEVLKTSEAYLKDTDIKAPKFQETFDF